MTGNEATPATAWMWRAGVGVNGATIDAEAQVIHWYDDAGGCACGDSVAHQTFADFHARGAPLSPPPADVLSEMRATIAVLEARARADDPSGTESA